MVSDHGGDQFYSEPAADPAVRNGGRLPGHGGISRSLYAFSVLCDVSSGLEGAAEAI